MQGIDHQKSGHGLAGYNALLYNFFGKLCCCSGCVVLGKYGVHVGVGANVECDLHRHRAIVGRCGLHIEHIAYTHYTLSKRCCHGIVYGLGICSRIGSRNLHNGWRDIGVLLNGERTNGYHSQQYRCQGQSYGKDRSFYEESLHTLLCFAGYNLHPIA